MQGTRLEILKANGITNAAHITKQAFDKIAHDFSHSHRRKLFEWRIELEKQFAFKLTPAMKKDDLHRAENDIAHVRLQLEARLRNGLPDLQRIANQINQKQQNLTVESEALAAEVRQAESDYKQVSDLQKQAIAWTIGVAVAGFAVGAPVRNLISPETGSDNPPAAARDYNYGGRVTSSSSTPAVKTVSGDQRDQITPEDWGKAGELYEQGEELLKAGKYNQAAAAFNTAAGMKPGVEPIYKRLAESYDKLKRYQDALNAYSSALNVDDNDYESHYNSAIINSRLGRWKEAAAEFRTAGLSESVIPRTAAEVGARLRAGGRNQAAIDYLKDAINQKSNDAEAHYELGLCYYETGDLKKVKQEHRKLKDLDAAIAQALYETALAPGGSENSGGAINSGAGSGGNFDIRTVEPPPPPAPPDIIQTKPASQPRR